MTVVLAHDVTLSAERVPFLLDSSRPRAAVGLRFDVVHGLVEIKFGVCNLREQFIFEP